MYKNILIGTDGSELGNKAVAHGIKLAAAVKARVTIVTATEPWSALDMAIESRKGVADPIKDFETVAADAAKRVLITAAKKASAAGLKVETVHVPDKYAGEAVIKTAKLKGCDLIVMASHGRRGIGRLILGSQAYEVLTHSKIPTLIVR